ncbi:MAG TPA: alpha/beta hydrolase [Porticoccaceae bacterium]|nr:alpha/beta hydrolase [Porticoccaceae bacterium]HIK80649.1 alpha/beta hydrolase [Porticoccaceae bacterium]
MALVVIAVIAIVFVIGYMRLQKDRLAHYDLPSGKVFAFTDPKILATNADALKTIYSQLRGSSGASEAMPWKQRAKYLRKVMDEFRSHIPIISVCTKANAGGVVAEWVVAPGADTNRRFLYIHGGAFIAGSPKSHRVITSKLSEITNSAVLAIDYRLMPEHKRMDCVEDCRIAYDWLLANGPDGQSTAVSVYVAGDSAGGNLTLSLLAWARDTERRPPNAAIALSPVTDMRMVNPSIKTNLHSDVMLKPLAKRLSKVPRWLVTLGGYFIARYNPCDPVISPLLGKLNDLPPLLVQASDAEILRDDGRRYVNKACGAGSNATLQLWGNMPHVWQMFYPELPAAAEAFDEIKTFIERYP